VKYDPARDTRDPLITRVMEILMSTRFETDLVKAERIVHALLPNRARKQPGGQET
jgi:hypothetical protein